MADRPGRSVVNSRTLAVALRDAAKRLKLPDWKIAERADLTERTVRRALNGEASTETLAAVGEVLRLRLDWVPVDPVDPVEVPRG